ncbi:hybrid sensor histidine kinase/response regulator [Palleronia caenipelagi]|nr:ATP-binding protein [Palleronia caenipelagi]
MRNITRHIRDWHQIYMQVLLISVVTAAITGITFFQRNVGVSEAKFDRNLSEINQVAAILAPTVDSFDLKSVRAIGQSLATSSFIHGVTIRGKVDYVMYGEELYQSDDRFVEYVTPILLAEPDGKHRAVGTLEVRLERVQMVSLYVDAAQSAALVFVITAVIGGLTTLIYAQRAIATPLGKLQGAIEQTLTLGQPVKAEHVGIGFVGNLQRQFNRMQASLLLSQKELRTKTEDLEASSALMREVLRSVRQSVRLFGPSGHMDLGDVEIGFDLPKAPVTSVDAFKVHLDQTSEAGGYDVFPSSHMETTNKALYFDLDLCSPGCVWVNVKSISLAQGWSALLITDITSHKDMELSLQHAQKMEIVATLTSGIAHDFNNVLAIIVGNLELIERQSGNPQEVSNLARQGINAARRATAVVTSLLSFSKRKPERLCSMPVAAILEEVAVIARTALGSNFILTTHCSVAAEVTLDIASMESSIINLIVNARDAMPNGGAIGLEVRQATTEELQASGVPRNRLYVAVSIVDQGVGVASDISDQIMRTFFTTKENGTGLGLSMVKSFAVGAGGRLTYRRNDTVGMTFTMLLPCTLRRESSLVPVAGTVSALPMASSGKAVMIVEDEDVLLVVMSKILGLSGYRCITCGSLDDVSAHFASGGTVPDMVITDLNLPDGTGRDLVGERFDELRSVPKLLLSGNMETSGQIASYDGFDDVRLKPVEAHELVRVVHELTTRGTSAAS